MRSRFRYTAWLVALSLVVVCLVPTAALASIKVIEVPSRVEHNTISLSITTDGQVAYGVLNTSATKNTALYNAGTNTNGMTPADTQTVQNTSTASEVVDFKIKSSNAIHAGGTDWMLGATAAPNAFTHTASIDGFTTSIIAMTVADTYVTLKTGVAAGVSQTFDLKIGMPTSVSDYGVHTITVTVLAVAH